MGTDSAVAITSSIDEIVGLLASRAPESLQELRREFPDQLDALTPGVIAGEVPQLFVMKLSTLRRGLQVARRECRTGQKVLTERLEQARRANLVAQVLALVVSSSLLASTVADARVLSTLLAFLNLLGSVALILARHMLGGRTDSASIAAAVTKLAGIELDLGRVDSDVRYWIRPDTDFQDEHKADLEKLIAEANHLCREVKLTTTSENLSMIQVGSMDPPK